MKKMLTAFVLVLVFLGSLGLTGCGLDVPRPEVEEGRFNISITYEDDGVVKEASAVYVCQYDGIGWTLEGQPYVDWKTHLEGDMETEVLSICTTEDGGEIFISMLLYPEYFMGDPDYADFTPMVRAELFYYEGENGTVSESYDDVELIAEYGVRLISVEYDPPIENSFKPILSKA